MFFQFQKKFQLWKKYVWFFGFFFFVGCAAADMSIDSPGGEVLQSHVGIVAPPSMNAFEQILNKGNAPAPSVLSFSNFMLQNNVTLTDSEDCSSLCLEARVSHDNSLFDEKKQTILQLNVLTKKQVDLPEAHPKKFVFLVDLNMSREELDRVKKSLISALSSFQSKDEVAIVGMAPQPTVHAFASLENKQDIEDKIQRLLTNETSKNRISSGFQASLRKALGLWGGKIESGKQHRLLFISASSPDKEQSVQEVLELTKQIGLQGIHFATFGFHQGYNADLLSKVAKSTAGPFVEIATKQDSTPSALANLEKELTEALQKEISIQTIPLYKELSVVIKMQDNYDLLEYYGPYSWRRAKANAVIEIPYIFARTKPDPAQPGKGILQNRSLPLYINIRQKPAIMPGTDMKRVAELHLKYATPIEGSSTEQIIELKTKKSFSRNDDAYHSDAIARRQFLFLNAFLGLRKVCEQASSVKDISTHDIQGQKDLLRQATLTLQTLSNNLHQHLLTQEEWKNLFEDSISLMTRLETALTKMLSLPIQEIPSTGQTPLISKEIFPLQTQPTPTK